MRRDEIEKEDLESVLLTLALSLSRYRPLMASILNYSQIPNQKGRLIEFLKDTVNSEEDSDMNDLKSDLRKLLIAHKPEALEIKLTDFNKHAFFIKRFAF